MQTILIICFYYAWFKEHELADKFFCFLVIFQMLVKTSVQILQIKFHRIDKLGLSRVQDAAGYTVEKFEEKLKKNEFGL